MVREEWRLGKGASERMLQQWFPIALKGSMYADRLPIGTETSIMAASPARLRPFYRRWYRPDLMAVVAVGDQPVAAISVVSGQSFADPFVPTLELRRLLELRASQLHLSTDEPQRRGARTPDYSAWRTTGRRLALASSSRRTGVV